MKRVIRRDGCNAKAAMMLLRLLKHHPREIADRLGIHPRTVQRWAAGTQCPNERNRAALRQLVGDLRAYEVAGPRLTRADQMLEYTDSYLMTDAERAERSEHNARMRAKRDEIRAARQRERQELALLADALQRATTRTPYRAVTRDVPDPFRVIDQPNEPVLF